MNLLDAWAVVGPPLERPVPDGLTQPAARAEATATVPAALAAGLDPTAALHAAVAFTLSRYYGQPSVALPVLPDGGVAVAVEPDMSWAELFDRLVACAPPSHSTVALAAVPDSDARDHAVVVDVRTEGRDLIGAVGYDPARVDPGMAERFAGHIGVAVQAMADDPHARTGDTGLLTPAEHRLVVEEWNRTETPVPDAPFHVVFQRQAAATPDAVAVVDGEASVTYGELNARANRLAHHLRSLGVGRGALVGLCLSRSPGFIAAVLAVMKSGAAYVPLDSLLYPADRIAFMVEDAGLGVIVTESALASLLPAAAALVSVDDDAEAIAAHAPEDPPLDPAFDFEDPAYAMYTSGSSGRPKCVVVPHRALANLLPGIGIVGVDSDSRVLQFAPCSFDISVGDLVLAVGAGAALHLASLDSLLSPDALLHQLAEERITHMQVSPSVLTNVSVAELPALTSIVVGAEPCPADLVARWARPGRRFFNAYGPTETTVCVTFKQCTDPERTPPIGKPLPNTRIYVLDAAGHPTPIGVPGEIHIGGPGVALGYLNRPELTDECFVPDPFAPQPGARMYRSGDVGRWAPDGDLEFLGRLDEQVKILGRRIELGEIESVLSTHPAVRDCVVAACGEGGHRRLVGYIVAPGRRPTTTSLRAHLRQRLPDFMVPAAFVQLDALPMTPNGKVDRAALPSPGAARPDLDHGYVAPEGELEETLARIWADVLGLDRVGATDDFFELGGDSILAIQAVAAANRAGLRLQARQLHQHPTVAGLAAVAGTAAVVVAEQGVVVGDVPLTPIQRWFLAQGSPNPASYAFTALFDLPLDLPAEILGNAICHLVRHHDALRMRFTVQDGQWRQENAGFGPWDVSFTEVPLEAAGSAGRDDARAAACAAANERIRLDTGPMVAAVAFRTPPDEPDQLYVAVHHLVLDGISWRILLDDLAVVTGQLLEGTPVELPPKTSSFRHWATRLDELATSGDLHDDADRWLHPPAAGRAPLRRDRPDGRNLVADERHVTVAVDEATTSALLTRATGAWRAGVTDLLLAAVVDAVCRWGRRTALAVDVETHGREDLWADTDVSRTVGWFTAMCPIDVVVAGEGPAAVVQAVKEAGRGRLDHALSYGVLRWGGGPIGERLAADPAPQVGFNYLGQFDTGLAGVTVADASGPLTGLSQDPGATRPHDIDVTGYVLGGRLHLDWAYSEALHDRASVEAMANDAQQALVEIATADPSVTRKAVAPTDFPLAGLDRRAMQTVLSVVDAASRDLEGTSS